MIRHILLFFFRKTNYPDILSKNVKKKSLFSAEIRVELWISCPKNLSIEVDSVVIMNVYLYDVDITILFLIVY